MMTAVRQPPSVEPISLASLLLMRRRTDRSGLLARLEEAARLGDIVQIPLAGRTITFINHPDYIKHVLVDNHANYRKGRALQAARAVVGNGLLTSEGDFHQRQRRMIQPAFHKKRIATYADVMLNRTQNQMAHWKDGSSVDLHHEMMTLTMRIVAECLFDVDVSSDAKVLGAALETFLAHFSLLDASPLGQRLARLPLPRSIQRRRAMKTLDDAIYHFITQRRLLSQDELNERDDLLSMLLAAVDEEADGDRMTNQQVRDEVMTLFLAGHETTANALSWTFYLLMQHPQIASQHIAELDAVLGDRAATVEDLPRLKYNRMVFSEAMRLYPPAWSIGRRAVQADEIGGYPIAPGSTVLMSQWVMHHDERYWNEPQLFRPERFDPDTLHNRPRYAYFPFGGGPRLCIGEPFAWMEGELLLATIAQKWRFTLKPGVTVQPEPIITLRLKGGFPVTTRAR
ncbi:MAG: cytochrome P450 [bacterium]|nr:cytochrome P450 [bacterium]